MFHSVSSIISLDPSNKVVGVILLDIIILSLRSRNFGVPILLIVMLLLNKLWLCKKLFIIEYDVE